MGRTFGSGGTALDIKDQSSSDDAQVVHTGGNNQSQVWEVIWLEANAIGAVYQIKNTLTSTAINIIEREERRGWSSRTIYPVSCYKPHGGSNQSWLIEPVLLPALYSLTNLAAPALALRASDRSYASDYNSRGVALAPTDLSSRNQQWTCEYTSTGETILRSVSHDKYVMDLSVQDSQALVARWHHGGPSQRWTIRDEDENNHIVSLTNVKTGTLLATRKQQHLGGPPLDTLAVVIEGNTRWQIYPSPHTPLFWATIQNSQTGAFLAQAEDGSILPSVGARHANDYTVQWRFVILGKDPRYVIVNRATGCMLEHRSSVTFEAPVVAENHNRDGDSRHWALGSSGGTNVRIVNVGSKCALNHYSGNPIQASAPEVDNSSYQWVITPFYDTLPSFALVNSHTGRCIANSPDPDIGTVTTSNNLNDFESQWIFYESVKQTESDPGYTLLNKMSGNVLEHYRATRVEAHDTDLSGRFQKWRILPLHEGFALVNTETDQLLCDPGEIDLITDNSPSEDIRGLSWRLISRREYGFDFIPFDFDILQRLLPYISSRPAQELQQAIIRRLPAGEKIRKGKEKSAYIPRAPRITRTTNDTLRVILTRLIGQWEDDSIPEAS